MKKIFLDCGANSGQSVRRFMKDFTDWEEFEIHCFEPNTGFEKSIKEMGAIFHGEAVSVEDGETKFFIGISDLSSTITLEKYVNISDKSIIVRTLDFSLWIQKNFNKEDYIIVKLNIEGAEYDLLEKMIKDRTFEWIDIIYIEFHGHKMHPNMSGKNKELVREIESFGTKYIYWMEKFTLNEVH